MKAFVFGIGGGGDAVSALVAYSYLRKLGYEVILGSIIWERYIEDPLPGPICFEDMVNANMVNECIYEVSPMSYAIRGGKKVIPQLVRLLNSLKIPKGYGICNRGGDIGLYKCLKDFILKNDIDLIVGVDAGGDVLAKGCEETLGSPLIDFISLSALVKLKQEGYQVVLGVIGSGSDGELPYDYFLKRISEIASLNGLMDIKGYDEESAELVERVLNEVNTEASRIPYYAFKGAYGKVNIRNGTRKVFVSPISAVMFFLDPIKIANTTILYEIVKNSINIEEANKKLNEVGIYTEYNFEIDLYRKYGMDSSKVSGEEVISIREEGKKRLGGIRIKC
ncbi:hypothetical protein DJ530_04875 [Sulfolobus sp. E1]|nr:hypothetical protein DJ530_04875 [Sulfolobus sp. E1]